MHTHMHTHTHPNTHPHTHKHTHTNKQTNIHAREHTCVCVCARPAAPAATVPEANALQAFVPSMHARMLDWDLDQWKFEASMRICAEEGCGPVEAAVRLRERCRWLFPPYVQQ